MSDRRPCRMAAALLAVSLIPAAAQAQTKLLRFPDIHHDRLVFTYAGDLWTAPAAGGDALRLTAHPGQELFARFSPDGQWIAFTGQYDGDEQVYVMPAGGGEPRQLTYYPARGPLPPRWGYDHQVYGWTPDSRRVLFRSFRDTWDVSDTRLFTVSIEGGLPVALPMPTAGAGAFSPDGQRIVYSPLARDFRTWKRYQGGWASDLFLYDPATGDTERITDHPRSDRDPMWIGEKIYFTSDRDGTLNLFAHDVATGATDQLTTSTTWDVRWPGDDGRSRIVYELGGELQIYDTATASHRAISIRVPDDGLSRRPSRVSAERQIEGVSLAPKGERALFVARGDVFSAPIEHGPTRNLTRSPGAHDKLARWSPDGKTVLFVSDRDGEEELYRVAQDGSGEVEQLTDGHSAMLFAPTFSPDGERVAFSDRDGKLFVLTLADLGVIEIADDPRGGIFDHVWSPRGGHLAFTLASDTGFGSIWIWSTEDGELRRVTHDLFNDFSPAWDPSGDYLHFISDRSTVPQVGSIETNYVLDRESFVYSLALRRDVAHPYPQRSDEVTIDEEADEEGGDNGKEDEEDNAEEASETAITIDFDGLAERVARVPLPGDNYGGLAAVEGHLLYVKIPPFFYGRASHSQPSLHTFSREDREEKLLADGIGGYSLSPDGSKLLVRQRGASHLCTPTPDGCGDKKTFSTAGLEVDRIPTEEWAGIFDEVWRRFRDWFYVPNMHGYDWQAIGERYRSLLPHVAHRSDLNYLMGEMIAELSVSHAYVVGGDFDLPARPAVALPGARFELDEAAGRYRIARILGGDNQEDRYRSPLTEIGVDAAVGDYLLAIDGQDVGADDNPYRLLRHKGDTVELTLASTATGADRREVSFRPIGDESPLVYHGWVSDNRRRVTELSNGRVGYLHLPDMGADGIREFIKWYYGQIRKEGLLIDVRGNGGGNVSQMIIERLSRKLLSTGFSRADERVNTYPAVTFHGHMACLLSETSASDGDIFPAMFRQAGLGPLIGKRSWGGVIGITNRGALIDGGQVFVPEFGFASTEGEWIIEGHGVDPDIVVENDPASLLAGADPQLERGVEEVLSRMRAEPRSLPERPADPVRTQSAEP